MCSISRADTVEHKKTHVEAILADHSFPVLGSNMRGEDRAAREQDRVRAEIDAADRAAADSASAMQAIFPQPGEDDIVHGWMTDYEISRLHTTVINEQGLLSLGLISSAQLLNSKHRLEQALELQSSHSRPCCVRRWAMP